MNKKAQSQVITTVLIILVVLGLVVIVWNVFNSTISNSSEEIEINSFTTEIQIDKLEVLPNGNINIKVKTIRGEMESLRFIFHREQDSSITIEKTQNIPKQLETKEFTFTNLEVPGTIVEVSVIPTIEGDLGMEVKRLIN